MLLYGLLGLFLVAVLIWARRKLYPNPYPGIPYNKESANRILGDVPDLARLVASEHQSTQPILDVTTGRLGTPIAQLLFPGLLRKPLVILDDPREIEDIVNRRNKEFDKAQMSIDFISPMFPHGTLSQFTTPELKAQKRLWADVMGPDFLRRAALPNMYEAALELVELWGLKTSTLYKEAPFKIDEDIKDATLDAIWVALIGEKPGMTKYQARKLECQLEGNELREPPPCAWLKEGVNFLTDSIVWNSNMNIPKWVQKLLTYTPRHRKLRGNITSEIQQAMKKGVDRFQRLELGKLEADELDTCMMDLVLRRQMLEAKKAGKVPTDPTQDVKMLDEMFVMLNGGHDSTANTLSWFAMFMDFYPAVQEGLRAVLQSAFPGPGQPSLEDILKTDIPYLDAACEESFRLSGTAKANLRQALVDTEILGCKIPKGAEVLMNYHVNHSPVYVEESRRSPSSRSAVIRVGDGLQSTAGRDLDRFEPKRWLIKDEVTEKETFNAHAIPSLAFGGGYRGCFGRRLAYMEFRVFIVLLVLNFEFLPLPEDLRSMKATEKIFREPDMPYVKLRALAR